MSADTVAVVLIAVFTGASLLITVFALWQPLWWRRWRSEAHMTQTCTLVMKRHEGQLNEVKKDSKCQLNPYADPAPVVTTFQIAQPTS